MIQKIQEEMVRSIAKLSHFVMADKLNNQFDSLPKRQNPLQSKVSPALNQKMKQIRMLQQSRSKATAKKIRERQKRKMQQQSYSKVDQRDLHHHFHNDFKIKSRISSLEGS